MRKSKGRKSTGQRLFIILLIIVMIWITLNILPTKAREEKPFFEGDTPMIIAHQGGEHLAPSSTMAAFEQAEQLGVDAIEFDIHITKDQYMVAIHDPTVDRTTDGKGRVDELLLEEIKKLDAGFYFQDLNGDYSFRGKGEQILTVEEIFSAFPRMKMVIEIKDTNASEFIPVIVKQLWELIQEFNLEDRILIASFDHEVIKLVDEVTEGRVAISGGRSEVTKLVVLNKLFLNGLYKPTIDAIQIPTEEMIFDLTTSRLIRAANRKGVEVDYWTINDVETMRHLINQGADGIITDRPDLLVDLLKATEPEIER